MLWKDHQEPKGEGSPRGEVYAASTWMRALPDSWPVARVSMPGAHNASASSFEGFATISQYLVDLGLTQDGSVDTLLEMGIRFLDLRALCDGSMRHGPLACSLNLDDCLASCSDFLLRYRSEFIISRIKDEEGSDLSGVQLATLVRDLAKRHPLMLVPNLPSVGEARGRILLLQEWEGPKLSVQWQDEHHVFLQDSWMPKSLGDKWHDIVQHMLRTRYALGHKLCLNFISAQLPPQHNPRSIAASLHPKLLARLTHRRTWPVGIMVMDFPTHQLCQQIVATNMACLSMAEFKDLLVTVLNEQDSDRRPLLDLDAALGGHSVFLHGDSKVRDLATMYSSRLLARARVARVLGFLEAGRQLETWMLEEVFVAQQHLARLAQRMWRAAGGCSGSGACGGGGVDGAAGGKRLVANPRFAANVSPDVAPPFVGGLASSTNSRALASRSSVCSLTCRMSVISQGSDAPSGGRLSVVDAARRVSLNQPRRAGLALAGHRPALQQLGGKGGQFLARTSLCVNVELPEVQEPHAESAAEWLSLREGRCRPHGRPEQSCQSQAPLEWC